jgi:HTH-type transcriptional regulator / antitoxin HigA
MITNEVQYRATKMHLEQFEQASINLAAKHGKRSKLEQLEIDAVDAQADDLRAEVAEYERLRSGEQVSFAAGSLAELATVLIKARIARGWTQRQLAEALEMAEQQIQRYEANDYRSTSLARLCDIADALGVRVEPNGQLRPSAA